MNSGITMVVCSPWECSSFLVQRFWLVSGGFVSKTIQIERETIQIGRIKVGFIDPSSFRLLSAEWVWNALFPHGHRSAVGVGSLISWIRNLKPWFR
ncbi:MAG TPA: hypothetical protein VE242_01065 [Chthoniobacterales bacterium]|nr:hypothetical protein [Chthoniobacterales bacterium]